MDSRSVSSHRGSEAAIQHGTLFEARNHVPAVAYVVGRYDGLDTSGSAFYLTAWESDDPEVVRERLGRLSRMAEELIDVLEEPPAR